MQKDYAEILFQSIDEIVTKKLEGISYDVTDVVTIIDAANANLGKYKVSDGAATYYAYSSDTSYEEGDSVYMTVPNGDYTQQKIIIGKYVAENDKPFVFQTPFETIVDTTGNLITDKVISTTGLIANNPMEESITLWEKDFREENIPTGGYTRLGIQGQFRSWLAELDCVQGNYGLCLELGCQKDMNSSELANYNKAIDFINTNGQLVKENTEAISYIEKTLGIELTEEFWNAENSALQVEYLCSKRDLIYRISYQLFLSSNDMYGDPFNFQSFYQQEKVFDISSIGTITYMRLKFYQRPNTFFDKKKELIPYKDDFEMLLLPNLFTKDTYICLGYDISEFDNDAITLFTTNSSTYSSVNTDEENEKKVSLRWFHDNQAYEMADELNCEVRWYHYALGAPAPDNYAGVYWQRVNDKNIKSFTYSFNPNIKKSDEKIKAVLIFEEQVLESNILTFTNEKEVVNDATKDFLAGLNIWCADGTYGNYYIYDPGNKILEQFRTNEAHRFKAMFSTQDALLEQENKASFLTEAESITWTFNTTATMIKANNINYSLKYNENKIICGPDIYEDLKVNDNIYTFTLADGSKVVYDDNEKIVSITRYGDVNNGYAIDADQLYFINEIYAQGNQNNVVQCKIVKDGVEYFTSKRLGFGQAGTTGTDATLRIYFDPANVHCLRAGKENGDTLKVRVVLYDSQNQEVNLNDETDTKATIEWKWYVKDGKQADNISIVPLNPTSVGTKDNYNIKIGESYWNSTTRNEAVIEANTKLEMDNYLILEATIRGWGDYELTTRRPIPIAASSFKYNEEDYVPMYVDCSEEVIYGTAGYPDYYKEPWRLHYAKDADNNTSTDMPNSDTCKWQIWHNTDNPYAGEFKDNILQPLGFYVEGAASYGAQYDCDGTIIWSQPILAMQNNYPSATLNKWDGKTLTIDNDNGRILATAIAAGKKNSDNSFSGVMIGDWSNGTTESSDITSQTGVYGFNHGAMSYAFKEDGTAFIGKSGRGRLLFDGTHSTITSEWYDSGRGGMKLDFSEGALEMRQSYGYNKIKMDVMETETPFTIGTKFAVDWDGTLHATNGDFSGKITSKEGSIGGFIISEDALYSKTNDYNWGGKGIFLKSNGSFSLSPHLKYNVNTDKLFIASNIYRPSATEEDSSFFMIGINSINASGDHRLQIGSPSGTNEYPGGVSIYGAGNGIYLVAKGSDVAYSSEKRGMQLTETDARLYGYTAENQHGIYARFA